MKLITQFFNFTRQLSEDRTMERCHNVLSGYGRRVAATTEEREHRARLCVEDLERHLVDYPTN